MESPKPSSRWTLVRSAAVGIVATLVDLGALWALVHGAGLHPALANVPALALGLAVQFTGNKLYAFRDRSRDLARQGARFAAVEAGAFALNALAYHLLVMFTPVPYPLARLFGSSLVYFGFSFPLWGRIFRPGALPEST